MSFDVLIIDLNMKALNALIWASAVLAKIAIAAILVGGFFYLILILISMGTD